MTNILKKLFVVPRQRISSFGITHTGKIRKRNEDNYMILSDRNIFVVADGMGGHNAGDLASLAALEAFERYFSKESIRKIKGNHEEIRHFMIKGFYCINDTIIKMAAEHESRSGMGCTLVSGLIDGEFLHTCHVGDSRCYVANKERLEQITTDHSAIVAYHQNGHNGSPFTANNIPRQVITRAIGFPFLEDPEYHSQTIYPGNRLLFCSDGLWSMVEDKLVHEILLQSETAEQAGHNLVTRANDAGGTDNITAVVVFY
jgi:PPM family protein phosphatase